MSACLYPSAGSRKRSGSVHAPALIVDSFPVLLSLISIINPIPIYDKGRSIEQIQK